MDIEFEILEDGSVLINRQNQDYNDMVRKFFSGIIEDEEALNSFLSATENVEIVFGPHTMCG
jgi:hypothetical protein